jgi:peptidoglycan/LPS O-acetylase OafA/YrhL
VRLACRCYTHGAVITRAHRLRSALSKVLSVVSGVLLFAGLALIGYGIVYWWKGFPYPVVALLAYSTYGCLALGGGLWLRRPETVTTLVLATISFALSAVGLIALFVIPPWQPEAIALFIASCLATESSYRRLRRRLETS